MSCFSEKQDKEKEEEDEQCEEEDKGLIWGPVDHGGSLEVENWAYTVDG